jgi:hypothetical protein
VVLGYGVVGVYVAMALFYSCMAVMVFRAFFHGDWADRTSEMIADREASGTSTDR